KLRPLKGGAMPRFSVVIPVRGQASCLAATLRTCLEQEFDDYEVLVSDNSGGPAVRQVVEGVGHPRLRYVRTPGGLAMTDSWEFAVARAAGEFITVLGADDGLLPHALREIDFLLRRLCAVLLRWDCASYSWPDLPAQRHLPPNRLLVPLPAGA